MIEKIPALYTMIKKELIKFFSVKKNLCGIVGFIIIIIVLSVVFSDIASRKETLSIEDIKKKIEEKTNPYLDWVEKNGSLSDSDNAIEGNRVLKEENINQTDLFFVSFTFTWNDEPDRDRRHKNQPDKFEIEITTPDGKTSKKGSGENPVGGEGKITIDFEIEPKNPPESKNGTGKWKVNITLTNAGDQTPVFPLGRTYGDSANDWSLSITYKYRAKQ